MRLAVRKVKAEAFAENLLSGVEVSGSGALAKTQMMLLHRTVCLPCCQTNNHANLHRGDATQENSTYHRDNDRRSPLYSRATPSSQPTLTPGRLQDPVIIPQRRPENKSRGWVLAYAPSLAACGIDQTTFLNFLHDFNHSSKVLLPK